MSSTDLLTRIELGLQAVLLARLGFRKTVADPSSLAALTSTARGHNELVFVTSTGVVWLFDKFSRAAASSTVVVPADHPSAGRFRLTTWSGSSGYLRAVELYQGESSAEKILARFGSRRPALMIAYQGGDNTPLSAVAGALYDFRPNFHLWILSSNLRSDQEATIGSSVGTEAERDPGINCILEDCKKSLAGNDLSVDGVQWCELGHEERVLSSEGQTLADRTLLYRLAVQVRAAWINNDDDSDLVPAPLTFAVQRQLVKPDGSIVNFSDPDTFPQP